MSELQAENNPPAILVLTQVIREYRAVNDPEGLGRLLFPLEQCLSGEKYEPPKTAAERFAFNRLLVAAERGRESYEKTIKRARAGAAASVAVRRKKAANPSPSVTAKPATVAPVVRPRPNPSPSVTAKPATVAPVPTKPPATVAPVARPRPNPSAADRRGGVKSIGDGLNIAAMFGGTGGDIADRINAEPVQAALEIIGETGNRLSENTLKKYLREKGAAAFADTLFAFRSEIKNGEDVDNRGAALFARLSQLPNISAGR